MPGTSNPTPEGIFSVKSGLLIKEMTEPYTYAVELGPNGRRCLFRSNRRAFTDWRFGKFVRSNIDNELEVRAAHTRVASA